MNELAKSRPAGHTYVSSGHDAVPPSVTPCVIGKHLKLEPKALGSFLCREIPPRAEDLLVIAGAVAFTDRRFTRHHANCWERDLHLSIPVRDLEFWTGLNLRGELTALLNFLTGDSWTLTFRGGRASLPVDPQGTLPLGGPTPVVIPYSNGLDSFAVARLCATPATHVIRVTTGRIGDTEKKADPARTPITRWVSMPISLPNDGRTLREQSYRSRAFLFGAVAATAAGLMQGTEIVVPESGQGTFGPALTVVGHEHPDVRMSPMFTDVFGRFVSRVFETKIQFSHPRIWHTKGETLDALRAAGLDSGWKRTFSCSRGSRLHISDTEARHCGLCANCLLRRQSLLAARLYGEQYIWPDLVSTPPWVMNSGTPPGKSEAQQAIAAILAMRDLASIEPTSSIVTREARALASALPIPEDVAIGGLRRVLKKHREEWQMFIGTFPSTSMFRELGALS